ncbi:MAG TPA: NAD(+) diphosphatase, partial [Rhizomicrobium sp.]|nr:NAD(+) diphosphatase [Rhizomicrobium sp.]
RPGLAEALAAPGAPCIFLGLEGGRAMFAVDISAARDPAREGPLAGLGHFRDARAAAMMLPDRDVAIMGEAKALIDWHERHGFCPKCGAHTVIADGGWKRVCPVCKAEHFPRTDPVAIMLATHGDACLVGRGRHFPPGMFSALAGFIEPGETIEDAVRRELMEEAGVVAAAVTYYATQPWPFPSSLMIGCFAEVESRELTLDKTEIVEAVWLERDEVRVLLNGGQSKGVWLPPRIAIAHHLIKAWAERD